MVKYKNLILTGLTLFFLIFSFYPTIYEVKQSPKLKIKNRDFILENNYYWPDFNLYLSKVRQGYEGRLLAVEKYTSEPHQGSLIQIFYLYLGKIGSLLKISPNMAYQLGRIILSPLLLIITLLLVTSYFRRPIWQILAFTTILVSGSFPHISFTNGSLSVSRYMEWWSNIDSLQRITFIPHILFGQVVSFYLLYQLTIKKHLITLNKVIFYIILANLAGLVFPPSLITLLGVLGLLLIIDLVKNPKSFLSKTSTNQVKLILTIFSLPSLLYLLIVTGQPPWSALVEFHRTHPMMIPFDQYVLGTGPVIFLGLFGAILAIVSRKRQYYPLIFWVVSTFLFASFFSIVKEQSPLRFTQTGLFIPLGILTSYLFMEVSRFKHYRPLTYSFIGFYLLENLYIMNVSLNWQKTFINQRIRADIPAVPYPPQTMYPLTDWMGGINWLRDNTNKEDVVLAEITAGNFIPAYSGNFVYFGQSNTVDYDRKQQEVDRFFKGDYTPSQARLLLQNGHIKYIFVSYQEKEMLEGSPSQAGKKIEEVYPFLKPVFQNGTVTIYTY